MTRACLLAALLAGPPPEKPASDPAVLRADYTELMSRFAARSRPEPAAVVSPLCDLHGRLITAQGVSHADRRRMIRGVETRLEELRGRLLRERMRTGGGASAAAATELIALIQATVAPESWDVNGGRNSIRYWNPNPALVIRATGEVHHQIGGTLGELRK